MGIRIWTSAFLLLLSLYDIFFKRIPNTILISFLSIILALKISYSFNDIAQNLFESLLISILFLLVYRFTKGIGMGDIKLISIFSFSVGFFRSVFSLLFGTMAGIIVSLFLIDHKKEREPEKIPFVPFITAGYFTCEILGKNFKLT